MTYEKQHYREIITKAVCGTGKQYIQSTDNVSSNDRPTSILGCWVINHKYEAEKTGEDIVTIKGSYDINVWYAYQANSKTDVITKKMDYCDKVELESQDIHCLNNENEVMVKVLQQPNCVACNINEDEATIMVEIEKEFMVKVIGETKIHVLIDPAYASFPDNSVHHYKEKHK